MSEPCNQEFSVEKFLTRVCNYILESAESVNVERYSPYVEFLRRLFVPSIEPRVYVLLEHFIYGRREPCDPPTKQVLEGTDAWLEAAAALQKLLRKEGLARVFVDSIVLGNRLDRINRELDRMGIERPELRIDVTDACEWIDRCKSTLFRYTQPVSIYTDSSTSQARQCRKRKATYEEISPAASESSANPFFDSTTSSPPRCCSEDQAGGSSSCSYCLRPFDDSEGGTKRTRSDKLRLVVTEVCQGDDCRRRRTDYLRLPCNSKALEEKVFQTTRTSDRSTSSRKIAKLNQRLQNVCTCLNQVMKQMNNDVVNDSSLCCDVHQNYVRFKLGRKKSNDCTFTTRIPILRPYRKGLCNGKDNISQHDNKKHLKKTGTCERKNLICKEANDETTSSGGCRTEPSTRFLWGEGGRSLATSSLDENASLEDNEVLSSNCTENRKVNDSFPCSDGMKIKEENNKRLECERKHFGNSTGTKNEIRVLDCCEDKKAEEKVKSNCEKNKKNVSSSRPVKFKSIGVMTDKNTEKCCDKQKVTMQDAKIGTSDIEEDVELTNIYINEISLCCCDNKEEMIKHVGINTECIEEDIKPPAQVCVDISTNTERVGFRENSTQAFFKEIQFCACDKKNPEEIEIKNINFDNEDVDYSCKCNQETSTDEKFVVLELENEIPEKYECTNKALDEMMKKLNMSPRKSSEFTGIMKSKINEIIDLNERIREKITILKENTELCSVSVQTLNENKSCESKDVQIQVKTSVVSITSNINGNTCTRNATPCYLNNKISERSIAKSIKVCYDSSCKLKKPEIPCPPLKKSILNEVTASLDDPVFQKMKHNFNPYDTIYEDCPIKVNKLQSSYYSEKFAAGDASSCEEFYVYSGIFNRHNENDIHCNCKCSQKSYFLNFLSDHLTRETFNKCKRVIRSILQKILEKGKMLNELRKSHKKPRCHCTANNCFFQFHDDYLHRPQVSQTYTCRYEQTTRLAGGADRRRRRKKRRRECDRKFRGDACRDFENRGNPKNRNRHSRQHRSTKRRKQRREESDYRLERSRRIEAFVSRWEKPYDVYDASSGSLPLSNKWKYC